MPQGKVKWFSSKKGYGFIREEEKDRDIFLHVSALENSKYRLDKGLITKEQIEKINKELVRKRELDDYELTFYDNYLVSCKRSIENKSKEGFWETFIVMSIFSWIGLYFANRFPKWNAYYLHRFIRYKSLGNASWEPKKSPKFPKMSEEKFC